MFAAVRSGRVSAAEVYGRRQKAAESSIDAAVAVKIDAMAMMGAFLKKTEKNTGAKGVGTSAVTRGNRTPPARLADVGITKRESTNSLAIDTLKTTSPAVYAAVRSGRVSVVSARLEVTRQAKRVEMAKKVKAVKNDSPDWKVVVGDSILELQRLPEPPRLIFADPPPPPRLACGSLLQLALRRWLLRLGHLSGNLITGSKHVG